MQFSALGNLRTTAMAPKTPLKKWIHAASNLIELYIPYRSIRQLLTILLDLNSKRLYRQFHVVVMQGRQRIKFTNKRDTLDVLVAVPVVVAWAPYSSAAETREVKVKSKSKSSQIDNTALYSDWLIDWLIREHDVNLSINISSKSMTIQVNNEDVNHARKLSFLFHILVSSFHIQFSHADTIFYFKVQWKVSLRSGLMSFSFFFQKKTLEWQKWSLQCGINKKRKKTSSTPPNPPPSPPTQNRQNSSKSSMVLVRVAEMVTRRLVRNKKRPKIPDFPTWMTEKTMHVDTHATFLVRWVFKVTETTKPCLTPRSCVTRCWVMSQVTCTAERLFTR